jgi:G:T/U-mismatch repair DNA glycosylase
MKTHPFKPIIFEDTKALIVGTLPPDTAPFYFSNSPRTRLWDILKSILEEKLIVCTGSFKLPTEQKIEILKELNLGIHDIIYEYERKDQNSGKDIDVIPHAYADIPAAIKGTKVERLVFVYKSAASWFLHSLTNAPPVLYSKLKYDIEYGTFHKLRIENKDVDCVLIPNPLNRGRKKGETLEEKLSIYKNYLSL